MNDDAPTTTEWIAKAESDFGNAEVVLQHGKEHVVETVCFHSQQCAEKYLKAFLQENKTSFPRTHSLIALKELCIAIDDTFENLHDILSALDHYSVAVRYPGSTATRPMAETAFANATQVRTFVRRKLNLPD